MKERISQLASGVVEIESPALELLVPRIEETVASGQNFRGDIRISSGNQLPFRGLIYSDDSRVSLLQTSFAGTSAFLSYEVRAEQLDPGAELSGAFCLVYNGGERKIPYCFRVRETGSGRENLPDNLQEFARLAEAEPEKAAQMADTRPFAHLPLLEKPSVRAVYDGLHRAVNRENLAEEFLIAAGEKERVTFSVPEEEIRFDAESRREIRLPITLNTWGEISIELSADAPWLECAQPKLSRENFEGTECEAVFAVKGEALHAGTNLAAIRLNSLLQSVVIPVVCEKSSRHQNGQLTRRERRKEKQEFYKTLLNTLAGKGVSGENLEYLQYCWEEMTAEAEPTPREKLYRAAIGLWKEDRELASLILDDAEREIQDGRREDVDAYCAFLYLRMRVTDSWEQKEQLFKILNHYRESGQDSVFLFLLQLHLDESTADRPQGTLELLESWYEKGCRSPFLYLEAVRIYNRHPDIIRGLDRFSCAVLTSAAAREYLTEETASYVASLATQVKEGHPGLLHILKLLYQTYHSDELLGAVCAMLIKGESRRQSDFHWFAEGVARDIRLTRLYDYYLYTAPRSQEEAFPREIVLYFSYNSPRDAASQKLLYGNLLRFYDRDRQIMDSYRDQMHAFVLESVRAGAMDAELSELYERLLELTDVDERVARILPDILNASEIRCSREGFSEVILVYGELEEELSAPLREGMACLPVYSDSCRVLLAAPDGTRYAGTGCELRPLMEHTQALEKRCSEVYSRHPMLRLKECRRILAAERKTEGEIRLLKRELEAKGIHRQFKRELTAAIVDAAIGRPVPSEDEIVTCVHYPGVSREQRLKLTEMLIDAGRLAEAERQVRRIGYRELSPENLQRLVSQSIQNGLYSKDELLLDMCRYLFDQGQADELILEYLCTHYNSASADMVPVLEEADARRLQLADMPERLLAQMLFTGSYEGMDRVFSIFREQEQPEDLLSRAYYVVKCSAYFRTGEPTADTVFRRVEQALIEEQGRGTVPEICRLALMRHYAEKELLTAEETAICRRLLGEMLRRGMMFAWMRGLEGKVRLPEEVRCREWIEYHGEPDLKLEILLRILPERKDRAPLRLIFPEVLRGIYVKPVLLFEGDELEWEIQEDGRSIDHGKLAGRVSEEEDHSRFAELNRLQALVQSGQRVQEFQDAVVDYSRKEAWIDHLFTLPD